MRSCCFDFIQVIANSENHLGRYIFGHLNPNSHVKSVAFNFLTVTILCLITGNELFNFDSNNLFLELVSIIINFIFFSSLICFNASLMRLRIESVNSVDGMLL